MSTRLVSASLALAALLTPSIADAQSQTRTPIKHLIVVIGENVTFDALYGTYEPKGGATVRNLLSQGIVNRDGTPGPHFTKATQRKAQAREVYSVTPEIGGTYGLLPRPGTTNAVGEPHYVEDRRFPGALPNGPFQITKYVPYTAYVGDPIHRFFQMWQQHDGGRNDLFVWVDESSGEGSQNRVDPASGTNQGSVAMGFYNMATGDAPYFKALADSFAISDNHHQSVMGGTGANFQGFATGHGIAYMKDGKLAKPPLNQIENPDPRPGTNNWYSESGYAGGSYTLCADGDQPGVRAIRDYAKTLPYKLFNDGNCEPGAYYLVNNYLPSYLASGEAGPLGADIFRVPPQTQRTIAEALSEKGVSWKWYANGVGNTTPLAYSRTIMTGPLKANLADAAALLKDLDGDPRAMPEVAFVTPPGPDNGHPSTSTIARYEAYIRTLVTKLQANSALWADTALLITSDEGGGYWDSGYIQIVDFFGDGTRIPLVAISPFARKGHIDHSYSDHASVLKFIEANWNLQPLSPRSRDHLPNPTASAADPYMPANRPAIGDLMGLFQF
jgi:phospholipase C